jgi:(5-formylfuran-3-yl)methyl phosphate synthase
VAFADEAGADIEGLPGAVGAAGAHVAMIDTADKEAGTPLALLGERALRDFVEHAHLLGLEAALAGSLQAPDAAQAAQLGFDIVGVRGAACIGGRLGRVAAGRVGALRAALGGDVYSSAAVTNLGSARATRHATPAGSAFSK